MQQELQQAKYFFKSILENYDGFLYLTFLESLKTSEHAALIESVHSGFLALLEADDSFSRTLEYFRLVKNVVERFQKDGVEETRKMSEVIQNHRGHVSITPIQKLSSLVQDYTYEPEGESSPEDIKNAKKVLISSTIPFIVKDATSGLGTLTDEKKEIAYDTMVTSLMNLQSNVDQFQFKDVPFLGWAQNWILNAKKTERSKSTNQAEANVWRPNKDVRKGETVTHKGITWVALTDIPAGKNKQEPSSDLEEKFNTEDGPEFQRLWNKRSASKADFSSLNSDVEDKSPEVDKEADREDSQALLMRRLENQVVYERLTDPVSKGLALAWFNSRKSGTGRFDYADIYAAWKKFGIDVNETDAKAHSGTITLPDGQAKNFNRANINNWKKVIDGIVAEEASLLGKGSVDSQNFEKKKTKDMQEKAPSTKVSQSEDVSLAA